MNAGTYEERMDGPCPNCGRLDLWVRAESGTNELHDLAACERCQWSGSAHDALMEHERIDDMVDALRCSPHTAEALAAAEATGLAGRVIRNGVGHAGYAYDTGNDTIVVVWLPRRNDVACLSTYMPGFDFTRLNPDARIEWDTPQPASEPA